MMAQKKSKKKIVKESQDEEKQKKDAVKKKENQQLIWFFAIIAIVFLIFLGTYYIAPIIKQRQNSFEYVGVPWIREDLNGLELYHGRFPVKYKGELVANYNLYLRSDPRENKIPIENVTYKFNNEIIISISPQAVSCSGSARIVGDLSSFLGGSLPFVKNVTGAAANKEVADAQNLKFANCTSTPGKTVILLDVSDTSSIRQFPENQDCYTINIGNCEIVPSVEKFMVGMLAQLNNQSL